MGPSNGVNGYSVSSAAALMDPRTIKQQMANGTPYSFEPSHSFFRSASEPLLSNVSSATFFEFNLDYTLLSASKDDTHAILKGKAKKTVGHSTTQSPNTPASARQLLDPKNYNRENRKLPPNGSAQTPASSHNPINGNPHHPLSKVIDMSKRDHDELDIQGTGSFIERLHGISHREERPQKKQKLEKDDEFEDDTKAAFAGGGKGGDLGEYVKQKKKEGLEESGPTSTVVDLTEGMSFWRLCRSFGLSQA